MMRKIKLTLLLFSIQMIGLSQDLDYAKTIIQKLSSPEFKGRGYVENGDKLSAEFISGEFKKLGLAPVSKRSYFQKFMISVNTFPGSVTIKIDDLELAPASDYLVSASSPSIKGKYKIVKTSRVELDSESEIAALIRKAENSFILIDSRDKNNEKPEFSRRVDEYVNFLKYSPRINIKGVIIYTNDKLTWEMSTEQGIRPVISLNKDIDINSVSSVELNIEARYLSDYQTQNVTGKITGTSKSDSLIMILAHYDHLGKMGSDVYFPGANDNASGVAMLLNLAKYYSANKPEYTMIFVALASEELGLLGAKAFTDDPPVDLKKIRFLVNFDLAGTGDEGVRVVNGSVFRDQFDLLVNINNSHGLLPKVDIRGPACNSDHCLFYQKNVPCFYIYTQGGIKAYHDIHDKYETLPLTEFVDYCTLMIKFFNSL